jgi:hypothetical protein
MTYAQRNSLFIMLSAIMVMVTNIENDNGIKYFWCALFLLGGLLLISSKNKDE